MPGSQVSPGFSGEGEVRQFRVVRGTTVSPVNVECMTKELTALAPSSSECSVPLWIGGARKLFVEAHAWALQLKNIRGSRSFSDSGKDRQ